MRSQNRMTYPEPAPIRRVIIADPDEDTRALYREWFSCDEWDIVEVADGRDALVQALVSQPSLLITELRLPFVDGRALCEILRRDAATRSLPIMVVTTETRMTEVARARRAGATTILHKPPLFHSILDEARRLCTGSIPESADANSTGSADAAEEPTGARRHSKSFRRFETSTPPHAAPVLVCPSCDRRLQYRKSRVGGVTNRFAEQWDEFVCPGTCGTFEYRHRTGNCVPFGGKYESPDEVMRTELACR
jgi:CheY-like chemotaxis protein